VEADRYPVRDVDRRDWARVEILRVQDDDL
jgi:hypothetical protein